MDGGAFRASIESMRSLNWSGARRTVVLPLAGLWSRRREVARDARVVRVVGRVGVSVNDAILEMSVSLLCCRQAVEQSTRVLRTE